MAKKYVAEALDRLSNTIINETIEYAEKLGCAEANANHFVFTILKRSKKSCEIFRQYTGIEASEFIEAVKQAYRDGDSSRTELTLDNATEWLKCILEDTIDTAREIGAKAMPQLMLMVCFKYRESEFFNLLDDIGVNIRHIPEFSMSDVTKLYANCGSFVADRLQYTLTVATRLTGSDTSSIVCRDDEVAEIIEILGRKNKCNPIVVGEPGVGKTAVVEELARRLESGDVPSYLKGCQIYSVDMAKIVRGTAIRGSFENNFSRLLNEVKELGNIILFFDEFHMVASSTAEGSVSALNMLKPVLSKGEVKIIGATTHKEFKRFIEKDEAFERRLESVEIKEPSVEDSIKMVNAVIEDYCKFHNCSIEKGTIEAAVRLADRYISDRKLPDKAITVFDQTAAHLRAEGVADIVVSARDIKETVCRVTGIDIADLDDSDKSKMEVIENTLKNSVIGQENAIDSVVKSIKRSKACIKDPKRPIGSFLFVGPTGVGKTELAKVLTKAYTGDVNNLIRIDMSEFMEKHNVSRLIGSPPGYVGYGEGGQLTEKVRHNPNSVVLFDEIEKAHPDVMNIMLQILDEGNLTDAEGKSVDFKNTIIIMTSNAGYSDEKNSKRIGFGTIYEIKSADEVEKEALKALESTFRPEFLNRIDKVVVFNKLGKEVCDKIVELELSKIAGRLKDEGIKVTWTDSLIEHILEEGYSEKYGARNLKRKAQDIVEDSLADSILNGTIKKGSSIKVDYSADGGVSIIQNNRVKNLKGINEVYVKCVNTSGCAQ